MALWYDDDGDTTPGLCKSYSHAEGDDEREARQRTCDCVDEHAPGFMCGCICHAPRKLDIAQLGTLFEYGGTVRFNAVRWICGDCAEDDHSACDGLRANGESCECRRCADAAAGGA